MDIAMIGLGKMGFNMATRLLHGGHRVVAHDMSEAAIRSAEEAGAEPARSLDEAVAKLTAPRAVWVMVPAGGSLRRIPSTPWPTAWHPTTSLWMAVTAITKTRYAVRSPSRKRVCTS